jgi:O-antigen ligase
MSTIEHKSKSAGPVMPRDLSGAQRERLHRLNDLLAWFLVGLVAVAAVPLGGNPPFFLALTAAVIGATGLAYGLALRWQRAAFRPVPVGLAGQLGFAALCLYLLVQALPLPWLAEALEVTTRDGGRLVLNSVSLTPGSTLLTLVQMLGYGLFFFLLLQVTANAIRRRQLMEVLFIALVAHALYAILALSQMGDTILFFEKWAYLGSATGTFVNRNSFATFLAFGLILGTGLVAEELQIRWGADRTYRDKDPRLPRRSLVLYGIGLTVILAALLATQSRMGIATGIVGALLALLSSVSVSALSRLRRLALFGVAALGGLAVGAIFGGGVLERLGSVERAADVRWELYQQIAGMIAARPWLGYGGGSFELAYPLFHQLPVSPDLVWGKAHNTYLALWAELGVLAGSIPIVLLGMLGIRIALGCIGTKHRAAQAVALGALATAALHSLVDFSLEIEANALLLLILAAFGLSAAAQRR